MEKNWSIKKPVDESLIKNLAAQLDVDDIIAELLIKRGVSSYSDAKNFFKPDLKNLHDPFLMKDMSSAIQTIHEAIAAEKKILIYGDYDVDGTTAVALVFSYFIRFYRNIDFYLPDREKEGYGISFTGIDYAEKHNFSLVVALDCGIKAVDKIAYANEKGIDFIICDHHIPGESIPAAAAVIDPKRKDCPYPFKELSGCGIGFKLVQAYESTYPTGTVDIFDFLDLVVTSIASDIVPILGENRILAYFGLKKINTNPRPGIRALLKYAGIVEKKTHIDNAFLFNRKICINDLVFLVGPRINAAGRIDSARKAVELLLANDEHMANIVGNVVNKNNTERRGLDKQTTQEAVEQIEKDPDNNQKNYIIASSNSWHKGVIGIVASRLVELFYKPTIVFSLDNDNYVGSARSIKGFDIYEAIDYCSEHVSHFGGHQYAAGLSIEKEKLEDFSEKFREYVHDNLREELLVPEIEIDCEIKLKEITPRFFRIINRFAPFGPGNLSPMFMTKAIFEKGFARIVGGDHLKLSILDDPRSNSYFTSIAFQQKHHLNAIKKGIPFDICYHIEENQFQGKNYIQLNIKDMKFS